MLPINLNYRDWIDIAWRRRRIAAIASLTVFGVVAIGTLLLPPLYSSSCQVLVQDNRAQLLVSPELQGSSPPGSAAVNNPVEEQDLNSERELITSLYLVKLALEGLPVPPAYSHQSGMAVAAVKAAVRLPLESYHLLHSIPNLAPRDAWALDVEKNLDASVIKRSNIIEVEFSSHDRRWTKDFLDRLMNQYLEFHASLSHDPQAEKFYQQQTSLLKARLEASEGQLRDYQLKTGIGNLDEQKKALIARISDLQGTAAKTDAQVSGSEQQAQALQSQLGSTPGRIEKETHQVQNLALQQLKPQVMQLRAERAELLTRYQPTSERIKEIDAKLASEEKILDGENHLEVNEQSTDVNPVWVTLQTNLKQASTDAASGKATQAELDKQIDLANQQLSALVTNGVEFERLQRQETSDSDAYLAYVRKTEEARASEALNSNKILNVSVARPPIVPVMPVFPSIPFNLAVGLVLAVLFGVAAAYWAEETDAKIYSSGVVSNLTGLPIVAILSERV
jgi:uncharacterized protein involved in exopolysaccharide biosynthesis